MQRNLQLQGALPAQIFVGLGGVGGRIVRRLHDRLAADEEIGPYRMACSAFLAIDTNAEDLDSFRDIPTIHTFHTARSGRAKALEVQRRRRDPFLEGWLPDERSVGGEIKRYTPREDVPGAGQIRVESRVGLYIFSRDLRALLEARISEILSDQNAYLRRDPASVDVFVFGSLAGGTCSGAFLPFAYLVREVLVERGWGAKLFGHFLLSTLMDEHVDAPLHDYIHGNTYAALKELEHLTAATYADQPPVPFVWRTPTSAAEKPTLVGSPTADSPAGEHVGSPPYDWVFLVDDPVTLDLGRRAPDAIADIAYLYISTAARAVQEGQRDNYTRFLRNLGGVPAGSKLDGYTKNYGAFGAATLVCPDETLVEYCAQRATARILTEQFASAGNSRRAVDPAEFAALDWPTRADLINDWWLEDARHAAQAELRQHRSMESSIQGRFTKVDRKRTGFWARVVLRVEGEEEGEDPRVTSATGGPVRVSVKGAESGTAIGDAPRVRNLLDVVEEYLDNLVDRTPGLRHQASFGPTEIARGFQGEFVSLRYEARAALAQAELLVSSIGRGLAEGEFLDHLRQHDADLDPITERFLLTRLYFQDVPSWIAAAEAEEEALKGASMAHVSDERATPWAEIQGRMVALDRGSKAFKAIRSLVGNDAAAARGDLVTEANQLYTQAASASDRWLRAHVRRRLLESLLGFLRSRMRTYADVAENATLKARELTASAERLRLDDSLMVDDFVLRVEVFDPLDATLPRQWDQVFDRWLWPRVQSAVSDARLTSKLFSAAFEDAEDDARRRKVGNVDVGRLLERIETELKKWVAAPVARAVRGHPESSEAPDGLDLVTALTMEAVFTLGDDYADADPTRLDLLDRDAKTHVTDYVHRKIERLKRLCALFARIEPTYLSNTTDPDRAFRTAIVIGHGEVLDALEARFPHAWRALGEPSRDAGEAPFREAETSGPHATATDPRLLVLYRAAGVIPLWTFRGVRETWEAYETIQSWGRRKPNALHIDRRWETSLPDLLPDVQGAHERDVEELLVRASRAGLVVPARSDDPDAWALVLPFVKEALGDAPLYLPYRLGAALRRDPTLRDHLERAVSDTEEPEAIRFQLAEALEAAVISARDAGERGPRLEAGWKLARAIRA